MHGLANHIGAIARFLRPNPGRTIAALALVSCTVGSAGAASALTLINGVSKMNVPENCGQMKSESKGGYSKSRCSTRQSDGTVVLYMMDEFVVLRPSGEGKADMAAGLELALREGFRNFIQTSVRNSPAHEVKGARLSGSQLPAGLTTCKKYSMDQTAKTGRLHEVGIFCAAWNAKAKAIVGTIGSVSERCMKDSCAKPSADFDRRANRTLKTFRGL